MHKKLPQSSAFKLFLISGMIIYQELQEPNFSGGNEDALELLEHTDEIVET